MKRPRSADTPTMLSESLFIPEWLPGSITIYGKASCDRLSRPGLWLPQSPLWNSTEEWLYSGSASSELPTCNLSLVVSGRWTFPKWFLQAMPCRGGGTHEWHSQSTVMNSMMWYAALEDLTSRLCRCHCAWRSCLRFQHPRRNAHRIPWCQTKYSCMSSSCGLRYLLQHNPLVIPIPRAFVNVFGISPQIITWEDLRLRSGRAPNSTSTETQKELKWLGVPSRVTLNWLKSVSRMTENGIWSHFWVNLRSLWGRSAGVTLSHFWFTFGSLLGHFNFFVSVGLGARPTSQA